MNPADASVRILAVSLLASACAALAQSGYPTRPIRIIVPTLRRPAPTWSRGRSRRG